jgi:hypothetical protein
MKTNVALAMESSLHHESYEMALEIYVLFTSDYTQVARILEINKNCYGPCYWVYQRQKNVSKF